MSEKPSTPPFFEHQLHAVKKWSSKHLNFYRLHLLCFTFIPLIAAAIFYASDTHPEENIQFIDALVLCVSAFCVCGLVSIELSRVNRWQQVILFLLMSTGSITSVSVIVIMIRKHFFKLRFQKLVEMDPSARKRCEDVEAAHRREQLKQKGFLSKFLPSPSQQSDVKRPKAKRLDTSMIRRVEEPVKINQMNNEGHIDSQRASPDSSKEDHSPMFTNGPMTEEPHQASMDTLPAILESRRPSAADFESLSAAAVRKRRASDSNIRHQFQNSLEIKPTNTLAFHEDTLGRQRGPGGPKAFPKSQTVDFRVPQSPSRNHFTSADFNNNDEGLRRRRGLSINTNLTRSVSGHHTLQRTTTKHQGFGGFPNPILAAASYAKDKIMHVPATPMPRITTLASAHSAYPASASSNTKPVTYITFDAVVGRNSKFKSLTAAQREELGGVEYRALTVLLNIVIIYYLTTQLLSVVILAPYFSQAHYDYLFKVPTGTSPTWFSFFEVWSAFSNTGMSVLDTSLTQLQDRYLNIFVLIFLILAGNTAFPIFLRFTIWTLSKCLPPAAKLRETLQFLLDHPRRCFIYLFPSYQTWFLLFVLAVLNATDFVAFLVLDIGNPMIEALPVGTRIADALMQGFAIRAAGFNIVNVSQTAPALQVLYVIMMYIAVYPIAMSIRSTNVYEERSMGVFDDDDDSDDEEEKFARNVHQKGNTGSYIAMHARKQLAFDVWWLVFALFVVCIVERSHLDDPNEKGWFSIFAILFELTSAYATVGLSLGNPINNASFCGQWRTLSKLVICAVIIRGRHRGLPIAIDRSVLLPADMDKLREQEEDAKFRRHLTMRSRMSAADYDDNHEMETFDTQPVRRDFASGNASGNESATSAFKRFSALHGS